jgi:hypothetical protein
MEMSMEQDMNISICVTCGKPGVHVACKGTDGRLRLQRPDRPLEEHEIAWSRPSSDTFKQPPGYIPSGAEDKNQQQRFKLLKYIDEPLLNHLLEYWINIYVDFPEEIEDSFKAFCGDKGIAVPEGMLALAPKVNGKGPCGGEIKRGGLQAKVWFERPSDKKIMWQIEDSVREVYIGSGVNRRLVCRADNSSLVLKMLADHGFVITKYIKSHRTPKTRVSSC